MCIPPASFHWEVKAPLSLRHLVWQVAHASPAGRPELLPAYSWEGGAGGNFMGKFWGYDTEWDSLKPWISQLYHPHISLVLMDPVLEVAQRFQTQHRTVHPLFFVGCSVSSWMV